MAKRKGEVANPATDDKTILTNELIEKIAQTIQIGSYIDQAALFCGISDKTFHRWIKQGQENPEMWPQCAKLCEAVDRALVVCETRDLNRIDQAAHGSVGPDGKRADPPSGDWRASAWKLERRFPKRWGKKEAVEVSNPDGSLKPQVIITLPNNGRARKD